LWFVIKNKNSFYKKPSIKIKTWKFIGQCAFFGDSFYFVE